MNEEMRLNIVEEIIERLKAPELGLEEKNRELEPILEDEMVKKYLKLQEEIKLLEE